MEAMGAAARKPWWKCVARTTPTVKTPSMKERCPREVRCRFAPQTLPSSVGRPIVHLSVFGGQAMDDHSGSGQERADESVPCSNISRRITDFPGVDDVVAVPTAPLKRPRLQVPRTQRRSHFGNCPRRQRQQGSPPQSNCPTKARLACHWALSGLPQPGAPPLEHLPQARVVIQGQLCPPRGELR